MTSAAHKFGMGAGDDVTSPATGSACVVVADSRPALLRGRSTVGGWSRRRVWMLAPLIVAAAVLSDGGSALAAKPKPTSSLRGVLGIATVAGKPLVGARVTVFARPTSKSGRAWFTKSLRLDHITRTNARGGFMAGAKALPVTYVVKVSGGRVGGRPFTQHLVGLVSRNAMGAVVNPVTTVAAAYLRRHPKLSALAANRAIGRLVAVPQLSGGTIALGNATGVRSSTFSPTRFMAAATRHGGLAAFSSKLARIAANAKARRSYKDPTYRIGASSTFESARRSGPVAHATSSVASGVLGKVLQNVIYAGGCDLVGPSLPGNMICGGTSNSGLTAAIGQLQTSVTNIQATLTTMSMQLTAIVGSQNQVAYSNAYAFAGISDVSAAVGSATSDLNLLNALGTSGQVANIAVSPNATSTAALCQAVYLNTYIGNANPYQRCTDFLTNATQFSNPSTPGYATLYDSLTGAASQPQNNLLVYTYQQALTGNASSGLPTLVPQSTLVAIQQNMGQMVQLQANAFALLGDAQMFQYMVTTGDQPPSCSNTTVSGTFPASTVINVADLCSLAQTSLFEGSVENALAPDVAVPPAGSVADARTNDIWWGFPVDLSGVTLTGGTYPYYPGSPDGSYSTSGGLIALAGSSTGLPILANDPSYVFKFADSTAAEQILNGLAIPSGQTPNSVLDGYGFTGLGTNAYNLNWSSWGVGVNANGYTTMNKWNNNSNYAAMTCSQGGYLDVPNQFTCASIPTNNGYAMTTYGVAIHAPLATSYYGMNGTTSPTNSSNCPSITHASSSTTGTPTTTGSVTYCTATVYGLLVDSQAPEPGAASNGVTPPFWTTKMLVGAPSSGVPATSVPAP